MPERSGGLLLTGASGFVGQSVLARWLARTDRPVTVLVRAADDDAAHARVVALLGESAMAARRAPLHALAADVTDFDPDAIVARARAAGAGPIDQVIHAAACVRFDQTLDEARAVNVEGTRRMLALARRLHADHPLRRYVQVSTAYVAGDHPGPFGERDRRIGQSFRNGYEQSKIESEELVVGASLEGLPVQVVRPSIVVGDRQSGWTAAFNVLYVPLRALVAGAVDAVPEQDRGLLDVVPVDYVADALVHLLRNTDATGAVNLVAGRHAVTNTQLIELACRALGRPAPRINNDAAMIEEASAYLPYFDVATRFDDRRARSVLEPAGIATDEFEAYFPAIIEYAQRARWGKSPMTREGAQLSRAA
jgi:thioester reductase-like protein